MKGATITSYTKRRKPEMSQANKGMYGLAL